MASQDTFASLGKHEAISRLYEGTPYKPLHGAAGFDSSVRARVFTASKLLLEGVDFDLVYFPLRHLGYKAVMEVSAQLTAALARPRFLSVTLGISAKLDYEQIKELWSGVVSGAGEMGYKDVSLDLQPSRNGLAIAVSASGETSELTVKRQPKLRSKDLICVSGPLGAAYMGLSLLEREKLRFEKGGSGNSEALEEFKMLVGAYLKPELSSHIVDAIEESEIYPACGVCVDKGLADAVMSICEQSGLGAKIYADKLPFEGGTFTLGEQMDIDPVSAAMNGGDDFKILFVIPILEAEKFRKDFQTFDVIGHLAQSEVGSVLVTPDGVELPLKAQGR